MKKLIAFFLILSVGTSVFALGLSLGFRAGAPYNTMYHADSKSFVVNEYVWGGNLSAVAVLDLFLFLSIQAEVGYNCRSGYMTTVSGSSGKTWSFPAIEVPMMVKFRLPLGFSLAAGPLLTIPVGKATSRVGNFTHKTDVKDVPLTNMLWGLVVDADFELRLGRHNRLVLDARFAIDFTDVGQNSSYKMRRVSFTPSLGYRYKF